MSGNRGNPGPGRPKGSVNKVTAAVKELLRESLDEVGGKDYLVELARNEPKVYGSLIGRLIPNEVVGTLDLTHKLEIVDLSDEVAK